MKKVIKAIAVILAVFILLGALPLSVSAAENEHTLSFVFDSSKGYFRTESNQTTAVWGEKVTLYVIPDYGYEPDKVYYINSNGAAVYPSSHGLYTGHTNLYGYILTMPDEDVTLYATFKNASPRKATLECSGSGYAYFHGDYRELEVMPQSKVTVYAYPNPGYVIDRIYYDTGSGTPIRLKYAPDPYTFSFDMPAYNVKVYVIFKRASNYYNITLEDAEGGTVTVNPSDKKALEGSVVRLRQDEEYDYLFSAFTVTDKTGRQIEVTRNAIYYEFVMPSFDVTVTPTYFLRPTITVVWLDEDGSTLDRKTYPDGREEPTTDVIPTKESVDGTEYYFIGWRESGSIYSMKFYRPVFRETAPGVTFKDVSLITGADGAYQGTYVSVRGKLIDERTNEPVYFETCTLELLDKDGAVIDDSSAETDYSGRLYGGGVFIPDDLEPGDYTVRVSYNKNGENAEENLSLTVLERTPVTVTMSMPRQAGVYENFTITGTVTYADGTPVSNCRLNFSTYSNFGAYWQSIADSNGCYSFDENMPSERVCTMYVTVDGAQYRSNIASDVIYIYGDDHTVTVSADENGTASADVDNAKCGDTVTLTAKPADGYRFCGWQVVKGNVTVENDSFIMPPEDVEIKAVFEQKIHTVTIDPGGYGEPITVSAGHGSHFFTVLDEAGVFNTLYAMENDDRIFRDLATKPLAEFADLEEFEEDTWELIGSSVTSDMTVYACFYQKIKNVSLSLERPDVGTVVTVDDAYNQTPFPAVTLAEDSHCSVYTAPEWLTKDENECYLLFEGEFVKDETYYVELLLYPDFGYWLDDDTVVTASGAKVEESYGVMALSVSLSAQAASPALLGDADGSGEVDVADATWIQRRLSNLKVPYPEETLMNGDVDGDGELTVIDATYIQRYCAHMKTPYPIGEIIS